MKLIKIPATDGKYHCIDLYTDNNNKFARVHKSGKLTVFGEDAYIDPEEVKAVFVITDNFDLFFNNIKSEL